MDQERLMPTLNWIGKKAARIEFKQIPYELKR